MLTLTNSTAGTAILSKIKPLSIDYTLPGHPDPGSVKGRIVTLEFESLYLVGTYVVNAGTGLKVCRNTGIYSSFSFASWVHAAVLHWSLHTGVSLASKHMKVSTWR